MPDKKPNILWICTDQQRYDTIAALGYDYMHTPNLDALVREGVGFDNTYCQSTVCTPSRASFLTGMYPSSVHGCVNGNDYWSGRYPLISKILADNGYNCGLVGKQHLSSAHKRVESRNDDGYTTFIWSHGPQNRWGNGNEYTAWLNEQDLDPDLDVYPVEHHHTTWCTKKALEFIDEQQEGPWLLNVNYFDPHMPFDPPLEYLRRYSSENVPKPHFRETDLVEQGKLKKVDFQTSAKNPDEFDIKEKRAAYFAMIELIDSNVGLLIKALEEKSIKRDTIIMFMSDHGEMLGDHGLLLKGCRFYDGLAKVPFIMSYPPAINNIEKSNVLVELIDVVPTLLELCSIPVPEYLQGKSLVSYLQGECDTHRTYIRSEYYAALNINLPHVSALIDRDERTQSYSTMIRDNQFKLIVHHGQERGELYNMIDDPEEYNNLWDENTVIDVKMRLLKESFDALAFSVDLGPEQVNLY